MARLQQCQRGAGQEVRAATTVLPVSAPWCGLYSEYMHVEYGELDC